MQYNDELQALRRELDDLLNRAAGMKNRIAAIERELRLESISSPKQVEPVEAPIAKAVQPPPLPVVPVAPVPEMPTPVTVGGPEPVEPPTFPPIHDVPPVPVVTPRKVAGKPQPEVSIEQRIGTYWLPRVGGVLLALAVGWLMVLGAQYSTPFTRVLGGYGVFVVLMIAGWRLEKNYLQYARILYAVGIAVSYFVTFAAHYIAPARIVESETVGITALVCVVAGWAVVAQIRKSKIVATLVTLFGHLTMGLAFFTSGDLARYSIFGVAVLGLGSAYFLLVNRWYYVAVIGLAGCYLNHAIWFSKLAHTTPEADFRLAFALLCVYMLTFSLSELFCAEDLRRSLIPTNFRSLYVTANTATFFILAELTFAQYSFARPHQDLFQFIYSGVLGLIALGYLRLRARDPLYNVYMTKAVAMFTLGLAVRYGQGTLTASLAVESVVLLYSARRSGLIVTRLLAFAVAILCVAQGFLTATNAGRIAYEDPLYWRRIVEAAFATVAMFAASQLYQRTDWTLRSPKTLPFLPDTLGVFWDLDLVAEAPKSRQNAQKPFGGLQFPYLYAICGFALFLLYTSTLAASLHAAAAYCAFVLIMTIVATLFASVPFGLVAMVGLVPVAASFFLLGIHAVKPPLWLDAISVVMIVAAAMQSDRRLVGDRPGLRYHQMPASPFLLYLTTSFALSMSCIAYTAGHLDAALYLAIASAVAVGLTTLLHRKAVATAALMLLAFGATSWTLQSDDPATTQWHSIAIVLIVVAIATDRFYAFAKREDRLAPWDGLSVAFAWLIAMRYCDALGKKSWWFDHPLAGYGYYGEDWKPFAWALVAYFFALYAAITRSRASIAVAALGALVASPVLVMLSFQHEMTLWPLLGGYISLAFFWGICERLIAHIKDEKAKQFIDPLCGICVAFASALMLLMIAKLPNVATYFLTGGWALLAFALFGVSLLTWQKFYRYAGLAIFFLATARLFKDAWDLTGFYKPLAYLAVSALMLIVSFGYYHASRLIDARKKDE